MDQPSLVTVPRLRAADPPGPRVPTRLELLTDLAFVVILGHLVRRMLAEPSMETLGYLLLLLEPVWWLWNGLTFYANRLNVDHDPTEFLFTSVELLSLLIMAAAIETTFIRHLPTVIFVCTYTGLRVVLLLKYLRAGYYVPDARPFIVHVQIGICLGLICWAGASLAPEPYSYYLWALALAVELLTPLVAGGVRLQKRFPPDARHLPGRVATFITLMLAQIASFMVLELYQAGFSVGSVSRMLLAGVTLLGLWASYFDQVYYSPVLSLSEHQRTGPFWAWIYLHLPFTLFLLLSSVGLALTVYSKPALPLVNWLVGTGVGGSYIITGLLVMINRWASRQPQPGIRQKIGARLVLGTILVASAPWASPLLLLLLCALTSPVIILTDQSRSFIHIDKPPTRASRFARSSPAQGQDAPFELATHDETPKSLR